MKPKDLLQYLEKGDRTLYHLTKKAESSLSQTVSSLNEAFYRAYSQQIGNLMPNGTWTTTGNLQQSTLGAQNLTSAQNQGIGMQNQMNTGGIIRW